MTYQLTNEEKRSIINQHLKNLEFNRYNLEISLIEVNAAGESSKESAEDIQAQINLIISKQTSLNAELASLTE
jgi:hypothetical protein